MIRHHHITCKLCYMQATLSLRWHELPMKPPGWKAQENNSLCYHQGKNGLRSRDDDSLVFLPNRIFVSEFHLSAGDSKLLWHCYMSDHNHSCLHAVFSRPSWVLTVTGCPLTGLVRWHYGVWNNDCCTQSRNPCVCDGWHRRRPSGRREQ